MIRLTIDGREVTVPEGTLVVDAATEAGIEVPVYCYHQALGSLGACRICLVEIEKMPKLATACTTTVAEGMVVHTRSAAAEKGRRGILEFLLINHPLDCPICDKGGECFLQDYTFLYGPGKARFEEAKIQRQKEYPVSPYILLDQERCVLCQRCVRFMGEYVGEEQLLLDGRGVHTVVTTVEGRPALSPFAGNVIDLCPVGALLSEPYHYRARPWNIEREESACSQCPVGCESFVTGRDGHIVRQEGRPTPGSWGWLCDTGRFTYDFGYHPDRLTEAVVEGVPQPMAQAAQAVGERLRAVVEQHGADAIGVLTGGVHTTEEEYALRRFAEDVLGTRRTAVLKPVASDVPLSLLGTFGDLKQADLVLVLGTDPYEAVPVVHLKLREEVRRRGLAVRALGERRLLRPTLPGQEHRVPPGRLAEALARAVASAAGDTVGRLADQLEPADAELAALGRELLDAAHLAVLWDGGDAAVVPGLLALARARGDRPTAVLPAHGPRNWLGAYRVGFAADHRSAEQILRDAAEGRLAALVLWGADPVRDFPDGDLAEAAVTRCPEVYFGGWFAPEKADTMTALLPTAAWAETTGTYVNMEGRLVTARGAAQTPGQARPSGAVLRAVARAYGRPLRALDDWDPYAGLADDRIVRPSAETGPLEPLAPVSSADGKGFLLLTGFVVAVTHAPSVIASRTAERFPVRLNPEDCRALGLSPEGGSLAIRLDNGREFVVGARADDGIPPGAVFVPRGLQEAPVNRMQGRRLTVRAAAEVSA
jgi:NADH-quinone oxidoreductase subunit G